MALSGVADWWDQQKKETEQILSDWVSQHPGYFSVITATAVQTSMDLGAGFVDVLRVGEGVAEGGWKGYGKDALRLISLLGPLGRAGGMAARYLQPLIASRMIRFAVQVGGVDGPCTFQAINNATKITRGNTFFVTVADMAGGVGKRVSQLAQSGGLYELGAWTDEMIPFLRNAGMRVREVQGIKLVSQVTDLAKNSTGPVVFSIKATVRSASGATQELLHSVIAMRMPNGVVKFADYGGKFQLTLSELVNNLNYGRPIAIELYESTGRNIPLIVNELKLTGEYTAKLAKGAILALEGVVAIETRENGVELAVPVAVIDANNTPIPPIDKAIDAKVVEGSFNTFKERAKGKTIIRLDPIYITAGRKTAPRLEYLTGVQFRLNALGFGAGPVDGIAGPKTRGAVERFQSAYPPLSVDGVPGPKTQAKLGEVCGY
jgi:hypothetical protein